MKDASLYRRHNHASAAAIFVSFCLAAPVQAQWNSFAHDSEHTAQSQTPSQSLVRIHWQTPVDLNPQYSGSDLIIHYGSALVTAADTPTVVAADGTVLAINNATLFVVGN